MLSWRASDRKRIKVIRKHLTQREGSLSSQRAQHRGGRIEETDLAGAEGWATLPPELVSIGDVSTLQGENQRGADGEPRGERASRREEIQLRRAFRSIPKGRRKLRGESFQLER